MSIHTLAAAPAVYHRRGDCKLLALARLQSGKATTQAALVQSLSEYYAPPVVRAVLWRLRRQGCITIAGGSKHRNYLYTIAPPGLAYLDSIRRRLKKSANGLLTEVSG